MPGFLVSDMIKYQVLDYLKHCFVNMVSVIIEIYLIK